MDEDCAHGRDYRTHQDDGTALCACGARLATDGSHTKVPQSAVVCTDGT